MVTYKWFGFYQIAVSVRFSCRREQGTPPESGRNQGIFRATIGEARKPSTNATQSL